MRNLTVFIEGGSKTIELAESILVNGNNPYLLVKIAREILDKSIVRELKNGTDTLYFKSVHRGEVSTTSQIILKKGESGMNYTKSIETPLLIDII